jgi:DivIVA domain-containing protein
MDVTPKAFRDVQFREKLRGGYHPEDVDEFLEQAAVGIEALIDRLQQATERADRAEKAASEASSTDDSLKRMLLLAQRTVDQAVKEAHDDADKLLADARAEVKLAHGEAEKVLADARAEAESIVAEAQERGRAAYEEHLAEGRASVEMASSALQQAQQEAEALRSWVDINKEHLLGALRDAEATVQSAGLLGDPPSPGPVSLAAWQDQARADAPGSSGTSLETSAETAPPPSVEEDDDEPDPRHLEGPRNRDPLPAPPAGPADQGDDAAQGGDDASEPFALGAATDEPGAGAGQGPAGEDQSMAFDERALDSFFSEQDLGDQRSTSRFRRRQ